MTRTTWVLALLLSTIGTVNAATPLDGIEVSGAPSSICLPEDTSTPDGMTVGRDGKIYLNLLNLQVPAVAAVWTLDEEDTLTKLIDLPVHPETDGVYPLGIAQGADGNLYVADNQTFGENTEHKSRLLRVVMKRGKAKRVECVATGFIAANAVEAAGCALRRVLGKKELADPVFGRIRYAGRGAWRGNVRFNAADRIGIEIYAGKLGPTDAHRRAFVGLQDRYDELKPSLAEKLVATLDGCRQGDSEAEHQAANKTEGQQSRLSELPGTDEIWKHARLTDIALEIAPESTTPGFVLGYDASVSGCVRPVRVFVWDWRITRAEFGR